MCGSVVMCDYVVKYHDLVKCDYVVLCLKYDTVVWYYYEVICNYMVNCGQVQFVVMCDTTRLCVMCGYV